jgi:hypothetical protein
VPTRTVIGTVPRDFPGSGSGDAFDPRSPAFWLFLIVAGGGLATLAAGWKQRPRQER